MGLLSSRTFRQIAIGAAGRYQEKRQTMRDRIDEYRERAVKKKNEVQKEYNKYFDEEKENINMFNQLSTLVGADYVGKLNSFAQGNPNNLKLFVNQTADSVRRELDKYQDSEADFIAKRKEQVKLKENELNQNLQDEVGLFKGTSTLFTRDLEKRGMKDIQAEAGTLQTQTLPSVQAAGPGMGTDTFVGQSKIIQNYNDFNTNYRVQKTDQAGRLMTLEDGSPDYEILLPIPTEAILRDAQTVIENGFTGGEELAIGSVMEKIENPNYDLSFLTTATENSPISVAMQNAYQQAKQANNTKDMQDAIDELRDRNLVAIADRLQQDLDNITTKKTDEPETIDTTTTEQPTGDIPGTKTERKGKSVSITTEDYISPEQKDINSKKEVTEDFIKQVMEKNNVDRSRAIDILKLYGYTQFPKIERTGPTFLKGNK